MKKLRNFNAKKLYKVLDLSEQDFVKWLQEKGLLHTIRTCQECNGTMSYMLTAGRNHPKWRCTRKSCQKTVGFLQGTWFENSHLSLKEVFQISDFGARQTHTQDEMQFHMQRDDGSTLSPEGIVDWKNHYRNACAVYFTNHPIKIGGPGSIIEIDEFPGSTIISDLWKASSGIKKLPEEYSHYTVNHSENFVDPETGACMNTIESTWQKFRVRHKEEYGTSRTLFGSYIAQFLWRKEFAGNDVLYHLWSHISEVYKCEF